MACLLFKQKYNVVLWAHVPAGAEEVHCKRYSGFSPFCILHLSLADFGSAFFMQALLGLKRAIIITGMICRFEIFNEFEFIADRNVAAC